MNPVLLNDLRKSLFRRKPVLAVALMALAILVLTLGVAGGLPFNMTQGMGETPLWRFPDLLLPVIAPAFAAGAFAKEYEQHTWQDVLLTRLTTAQILGGKFFACLLPTIMMIVVVFPPFALLLILQNIEWAQEPGAWIAVVALKFLISATFYLAVVLVCSYHSRNARIALVAGYVALAGYWVFNYLLWTYMLNPLFFMPVHEGYVDNDAPYATGLPVAPWAVSRASFNLSAIEWVHLIESTLFSVGLLVYLTCGLRRPHE